MAMAADLLAKHEIRDETFILIAKTRLVVERFNRVLDQIEDMMEQGGGV